MIYFILLDLIKDRTIYYPIHVKLLEFMMGYEREILLSYIPFYINDVVNTLSKFENSPIKNEIILYMNNVISLIVEKLDLSSFIPSKNIDEFGKTIENNIPTNIANIILLVTDFSNKINRIKENDAKANDKLSNAFIKFKEQLERFLKKLTKVEKKETLEQKETENAARLDNLGIVEKLNEISNKIADPNIKNPNRKKMLEFNNHELREFIQKNMNTNFDKIIRLNKLIEQYFKSIMEAKTFEELFKYYTKLREEFYKLK